MDESTILKMGQEVRILWGKWGNVVGTISAIEHIRGGVFYHVNNDKGERSPNLYGISHLDVIQNTTDEPTLDELKAQVDALVAELAHQQAENERLREYIAVLQKDFAAIVGFWHEELAKNSPALEG